MSRFFNDPTEVEAPSALFRTWDAKEYRVFGNFLEELLLKLAPDVLSLFEEDALQTEHFRNIVSVFKTNDGISTKESMLVSIFLNYFFKLNSNSNRRSRQCQNYLVRFISEQQDFSDVFKSSLESELLRKTESPDAFPLYPILLVMVNPDFGDLLVFLDHDADTHFDDLLKTIFDQLDSLDSFSFAEVFLVARHARVRALVRHFARAPEEATRAQFVKIQDHLAKCDTVIESIQTTIENITSVESWDTHSHDRLSNLFQVSLRAEALLSSLRDYQSHVVFYSQRAVLKSKLFKRFLFRCLVIFDKAEICKTVLSKKELQECLGHLSQFETDLLGTTTMRTEADEASEDLLETLLAKLGRRRKRSDESRSQIESPIENNFFCKENLQLLESTQVYMVKFFANLSASFKANEKLTEKQFQALRFYFDGIQICEEKELLEKHLTQFYSFSSVLESSFAAFRRMKFDKDNGEALEYYQNIFKDFDTSAYERIAEKDLDLGFVEFAHALKTQYASRARH